MRDVRIICSFRGTGDTISSLKEEAMRSPQRSKLLGMTRALFCSAATLRR